MVDREASVSSSWRTHFIHLFDPLARILFLDLNGKFPQRLDHRAIDLVPDSIQTDTILLRFLYGAKVLKQLVDLVGARNQIIVQGEPV